MKPLRRATRWALLLGLPALLVAPGWAASSVGIVSVSLSPSLPGPGQKVTGKVLLQAAGPVAGQVLRLFDVYDREIAAVALPSSAGGRFSVDVAFVVPSHAGRYNHNMRVNVGGASRFVNVPVSDEPVVAIVVEDLAVRAEQDARAVSFTLRNAGNTAVTDARASVFLNPEKSALLGSLPGTGSRERALAALARDEARRVTLRLPTAAARIEPEKPFAVGVRVSGLGDRPVWKTGRFVLRAGSIAPLHAGSAHSFYTDHAIELLRSSGEIYQELSLYRETIKTASLAEDEAPDLVFGEIGPLLYIHHFMDFDNHPYYSGLFGTGLVIADVTPAYVESSYEKAAAYWGGWTLDAVPHPGIVDLYLGNGVPEPDKITAYDYLGRLCHLIEDNFTPAHVHSDVHGIIEDDEFEEVFELETDPDTGRPRYERFDETSARWGYWRDYIGNRNVYDLAELFTAVNQHTDFFPSDDYEGDQENFSNPWSLPQLLRSDIIFWDLWGDHSKLPGMQQLANRVSPGNVMACASISRLLWDNTH